MTNDASNSNLGAREPGPPAPTNRKAKLAIAVMALISLLIGFVLYVFADAFGIERKVATLIAIAFLVAGLADYLLLANWDRIGRLARSSSRNSSRNTSHDRDG